MICVAIGCSLSLFANESELKYKPCDPTLFQSNMTLIAQVQLKDQVLTDCQVAVLDADDICRASNFSAVEDDGLVYLTVLGEGNGTELFVRVIYTDESGEHDAPAVETLVFSSDAMLGSFEQPYIITVDEKGVGIDETTADPLLVQCRPGGLLIQSATPVAVQISTLLGVTQQHWVDAHLWVPLPRGVYIVNGKKYRVTQ